jgi:hypothetical protein
MIILYAVVFGATMKVADLFNEHRMRPWFPGSDIVFGILWGVFGAQLIILDVYVANVVAAMTLAFIVRMRIDYRNHAIASLIILTTFIVQSKVEPMTLFVFLANFVLFGSIRDYLGDVVKRKSSLYTISESGWYYAVPTLIYSLLTTRWLVFVIFTTYIVSYDIVKYSLEHKLAMERAD